MDERLDRCASPRAVKLAYLVSHPIQYQAPLLRRIAAMPEVDLHVFFQSDFSTRAFRDAGFGETIAWDVPLLDGYRSTVLPVLIGPRDRIGTWTPINVGLLGELKRGGFEVLWVHGYARPYNIAISILAALAGLKVLIRDDVHQRGKRRLRHLELAKRGLVDLYLRLGATFLAIGRLNHEYYRELGVGEARIVRLPYAVDNAFFQQKTAEAAPVREALRSALGLAPVAPILLFAGKFQARKRAGDLLAAYSRLLVRLREVSPCAPTPHLVYAGSGEGLAETRAAAARFPHVRFLGFQSQAQLARLFDLCDVLVVPSALEPWGLVVNEAMNAGKPVIVTDEVGCGPDLVHHGRNGFIYPVGDCDRLAEHLLTLMLDPALRAAMGRHSLEIISTWSFDQDCEGLRAVLARMQGEPTRRA